MTRPLRVWLLDQACLVPQYDTALAEALAAAGCRVRWVTTPFHLDDSLPEPAGVGVDRHYFPLGQSLQRRSGLLRKILRTLQYPRDHRRLLAKLRREPPDVLHAQWSRLPTLDRRFLARVRRAGVPVVHTVHDVEPLYAGAGSRDAQERLYADCEALIVHGEGNRRDLLDRFPSIDAARVHVIPHGPLQHVGLPADADREGARASLDIPPDAKVVLFFGTIKSYKGLDILVDAFREVHAAEPDAFLVIVGRPGGPADEPSDRSLARLGDAVRCHFGYIPTQDVWRHYLSADVVALPYRRITQSGVLFSAMANGVPVVVSDVGGPPEVVRTTGCGWVVPPEDPAALAETLLAALGNAGQLRRRGAAGRAAATGAYSWHGIAAKTLAVYRHVAGMSADSSP